MPALRLGKALFGTNDPRASTGSIFAQVWFIAGRLPMAPINCCEVDQPVGSLALGSQGGLVLALRDGFALIPAGAEKVEQLIPVEKENSGTRMNDGRCDPAGRFWAGTMSSENLPGAGSLYRLEQVNGAFRTQRVFGGLTIANGIDWSPDGRRMYYIDSPNSARRHL